MAVAAAAFRPVERKVGIDEQPAWIGNLVEIAGDADGDAEAAFVAVIGHRLVHLFDDAVGELCEQLVPVRLVGLVDLAQHDELVAADPGDEIARPEVRLQDPRRMHQHGVARGVAERVVDLLETVEVEVQQPCALAFGLELLDMRRQHFVEIAPVGQAGQRIVQRVELDAFLCGFQLGVARLGQHVCVPELLGESHV